jgi:hypothetical protein
MSRAGKCWLSAAKIVGAWGCSVDRDVRFEAHSQVSPGPKNDRTITPGPFIAKLATWMEGEER